MSTNGKTLKFRAAKLKGFKVLHNFEEFASVLTFLFY